MARRTPQLAEHSFASMCARRGAVCNKSTEDETGWDFVVEFPAHTRPGLPADMAPGSLCCLVQVKSTTLGRPRTQVKLSNALRFANAPLPCFVVLFVYGRDEYDPAVYVAHFWHDLIGRTLEAARRLAASRDVALHKHYLPLAFTAEDRTEDPLGRIVGEVGSPESYGARKAFLLGRTGFEDGFGVASIAFGPAVTPEQIVDVQIGLGGQLKVDRFQFVTKRFGIEAGPPLADFTSGTLSVEAAPVGTCIVSLSPEAGGVGFDTLCEIYIPGQADLPPEHMKLRIASTILDMTLKPHTREASFRIDVSPERRLALADAARLIRLREMLAAGTVDCQVTREGLPLVWGTIVMPGLEEHAGWARVAEFLTHAAERVTAGGLPEAFSVSLADLRDRFQAIVDYLTLVGTQSLQVSSDDSAPELAVGTACVALHTARVDFERCSFGTVVRRDGRLASRRDGRVALKLGAGTCLRTLALAGSGASRTARLDGEAIRLAEVMARDGAFPVFVLPERACFNGA